MHFSYCPERPLTQQSLQCKGNPFTQAYKCHPRSLQRSTWLQLSVISLQWQGAYIPWTAVAANLKQKLCFLCPLKAR